MERFRLAARRVRSLTYTVSSEPLDRNIAPRLAMYFQRYLPYPDQLPLPLLQKLTWDDDGGDTPSPILFLLLSPALKLDTFSLTASYKSPLEMFAELYTHMPRGLRMLKIDWVDHEENRLYEAASIFLNSLPELEELWFSKMQYKALLMHPVPNGNPNLKTMTIRSVTEEQVPIRLLDDLARSVPSVERLRLEVVQPEDSIVLWSFNDFHPLTQVPRLKEFQVFADGDCIAAESRLLPNDVRTMGNCWKELHDLNLHDILSCSPQILDSFGEWLPNLQRLALCFDDWKLGDSANVKCLRRLRVLAFNIEQTPKDVVGLVGLYLAFVCPKNVRFASVSWGDAADEYHDVFATVVDADEGGVVGELCRTVNAVTLARAVDRARIASEDPTL